MTTPPDTMPDEIWIGKDTDGRLDARYGKTDQGDYFCDAKYLSADLAAAREAALMAVIAELAEHVLDMAYTAYFAHKRINASKSLQKNAAIITAAQAQTKGGKL